MNDQPELSQAEWTLVVELLEHERNDLPVEIRHTRIARVRDDLRERMGMVDRLLERLRTTVPG